MQLRILGLEGSANVDLVTIATAKLTTAETAAVLVQTKLSDEEKESILIKRGLKNEEAKAALATAAHSATNVTATGTTTLLNKATLHLKTSLKGLWGVMKAHPYIAIAAAIGLAISAVVQINKKIEEQRAEARQVANEAAQKLGELNKTTKEYSDRVRELRTQMDSGILTEEEYYSAKKELLDIQNDLINNFGDEAKGIDLVTGSIENQIDSIEKLSKTSWESFKEKNSGAIQDSIDIFTDFNNRLIKHDGGSVFTDDSYAIDLSVNIGTDLLNEYKKYIDEEIGKQNLFTYGGAGESKFHISWRTGETNIFEVRDIYQKLYQELEKLGKQYYGEDYLDYVGDSLSDYSEVINQIDALISENQNTFNQYVEGLLAYDDTYSASWSKILVSQKKYNDALLYGNESDIASAKEEMDSARESWVAQGFTDEAVNLYVDDFFETWDKATKTHQLTIDIKADINGENTSDLFESVKDQLKVFSNNNGVINLIDIESAVADEEDIVAGQLTEQQNAYLQLKAAAESYGITIGDLINALVKYGYVQGNLINNGDDLSSNFKKKLEDTNNLLSSINSVKDVLLSQSAGMSISLEDFNSDELKDYTSALEYSNGVLQLNVEKVNELIDAKAEEQVAHNNSQKAMAQSEYLENAKRIGELRKQLGELNDTQEDQADLIESEINMLTNRNDDLLDACNRYDLLSASIRETTGAYQHWLNAQNASQSGDMFDDALNALTHINNTLNNTKSEFYNRVNRTDYQAAIDFIIPDHIDKEDKDAVNTYLKGVSSLFTYDGDGNRVGLNIVEFCERAKDAGLMVFEEASQSYRLVGKHTMEDYADGLGLSMDLVKAAFGEIGEFVPISLESDTYKTFGDYAVAADVAKNYLNENGYEIDIDFSNIDNVNDKITAIDAKIDEISSIDVSADSSEAEHLDAIITHLVLQKQQLKDRVLFDIDTTKLSSDGSAAIKLLQDYQIAYNELELRLKRGLDTTDARADVAKLFTEIRDSENLYISNLKLDARAHSTLNDSISNLSVDDIKVGLGFETDGNDELFKSYQESDDKNVTVTYLLDSKAVDEYDPKNLKRYVDYYLRVHGGIIGENSADTIQNGSYGSISGISNAGGSQGTAPGGKALVGELGREIVVDPHTGRWYTVGDKGAEFRNIPRGAIVFNHKQTESLLKNGYVSSRAVALAGGTALASVIPDITIPLGLVEHSTTGAQSGSSNQQVNSSKEKLEVFDWIEIAINRIERVIDRLSETATSTYNALKTKLGAAYDEIAMVNKELAMQEKAYAKYMEKANSVGLPSDLIALIQNGEIDLSEYDEETQKLIADYQSWYEKALACSDAVQQLHKNLASLYEENFNSVKDDFDNQLKLLEHMTVTYENGIDMLEAQGYLQSTEYYTALQDVGLQNIEILNNELESLKRSFSEAMASGEIEEGSAAWYNMQLAINDVKEQIDDAELSLAQYEKTMSEIEWEHFDYTQERIAQVTKESDFMIELLSYSDMHTDDGQLTDEGMATMGLHGLNYNTYMSQADDYAKEILEIDKQLADDPYNTRLIKRREDLLSLQQDSIIAAEDEKQAMIDLVRNGIELELDSLKELIDNYTEALDSAKDLYEYQKKIKEHTKAISSIHKQLSAYENDFSEETQAKVQQLKVQLEEAESNLYETEYNQYISDQKKLLDKLYLEYEEVLNERMDNTEALLEEMIGSVNENADIINNTLEEVTDNAGYTMTENMQSIWNDSTEAIDGVISTYGDDFGEKLTSVNNVLSKIEENTSAMITNSDENAKDNVENTTPTTIPDISSGTPPADPNTEKEQSKDENNHKSYPYGKASDTLGNISSGSGNHIKAIQYALNELGYGNAGTKSLDGIYGDLTKQAVMSFQRDMGIGIDGIVGDQTREKFRLKGYKTGGLVDYTGLAMLDGTPSKPELVLNAQDTANFIALKETLRRMSEQGLSFGTSYGSAYVQSLSGITDISKKIASIRDTSGINTGVNIGDTQITIEIDHVEDYNDFVAQLQKDKQFERFVQSMTVDRLVGGTSLKKNKYFGNR